MRLGPSLRAESIKGGSDDRVRVSDIAAAEIRHLTPTSPNPLSRTARDGPSPRTRTPRHAGKKMPPKAPRAARAHFVYQLVGGSPQRVFVGRCRTTTPRTWHPPSDGVDAAASARKKRKRDDVEGEE